MKDKYQEGQQELDKVRQEHDSLKRASLLTHNEY